jgi:hypothetical protein
MRNNVTLPTKFPCSRCSLCCSSSWIKIRIIRSFLSRWVPRVNFSRELELLSTRIISRLWNLPNRQTKRYPHYFNPDEHTICRHIKRVPSLLQEIVTLSDNYLRDRLLLLKTCGEVLKDSRGSIRSKPGSILGLINFKFKKRISIDDNTDQFRRFTESQSTIIHAFLLDSITLWINRGSFTQGCSAGWSRDDPGNAKSRTESNRNGNVGFADA